VIESTPTKERVKVGTEYDNLGLPSAYHQTSSLFTVAAAEVPRYDILEANLRVNQGRSQTARSSQTPEAIKLESETTGGRSTYNMLPTPPESPAKGDEMHREYIAEHLPRKSTYTASRGSLFNQPDRTPKCASKSPTASRENSINHRDMLLQPNAVSPTLKLPRGTRMPSESSSGAAGSTNRPIHATGVKQVARRSKTDRIFQAWMVFNNELLEIDQEADEEDDEDDERLYNILDYMVCISRDCLYGKGVKKLLDLAEEAN
jgi:hypothetical protein